jgi:hypothetical protein
MIIGILVLAGVLGAYGCGGDSDKVVVDFSKTVSVERPGSGPRQIPLLGWQWRR